MVGDAGSVFESLKKWPPNCPGCDEHVIDESRPCLRCGYEFRPDDKINFVIQKRTHNKYILVWVFIFLSLALIFYLLGA